MRLSPIIFGALLGLARSSIIREGFAHDAAADPTGSNSVDAGKAAPPTSSAPSLPTSPPADNNSSSDNGGNGGGSSSSSSSSSISSPSGGDDVTVTVTDTVTNTAAADIVTKDVTMTTTSTKSVIATSTVFVTVTATGSGETATKVVFSTTTIFVNMKRRALPEDQLPARTTPAQVDAISTDLPQADGHARRWIEKRATVTVTKTVTVGSGGGTSTVTESITKLFVTPVSSVTTVTDTITETVAPNAKTTITTTSVLTVTSTIVNTGVIESTTAPGNPSASGGSNNDGSSSGSSSSSSPSKGISTGAKAGIGIGAGVGGLAILGFVLFLVRRRSDRGPSPDPDDLVGASEVPIGPSGRNPPTSGNSAAAASLLGVTRPAAKPVSAEGYRGTAMGDGRAGFAKPDTFAPSYAVTPVSTTTSPVYNMTHAPEVGAGTAELGTDSGAATKWHDPSATEIDSHPVMSHRSGPVYEMPVQNYQ